MASVDGLKLRKLLESGTVVQATDNTSVAFRMMYQGNGAVTSVTVNQGSDITTVTTGTINGVTEGTKVYAFSDFPTMGQLVAGINSDGIFQVKILDTLQSQDTTNSELASASLTTPTYDGLGNAIFDIVIDTSSIDNVSVCLSAHRNMLAPNGHRVHLQEIQYYIDSLNSVFAGAVQVWKRKFPNTDTVFKGSGVESQILGALSVSGTLTVIDWANGKGKISGGNDEDIIVVIYDDQDITTNDANFVQVSGIIE